MIPYPLNTFGRKSRRGWAAGVTPAKPPPPDLLVSQRQPAGPRSTPRSLLRCSVAVTAAEVPFTCKNTDFIFYGRLGRLNPPEAASIQIWDGKLILQGIWRDSGESLGGPEDLPGASPIPNPIFQESVPQTMCFKRFRRRPAF